MSNNNDILSISEVQQQIKLMLADILNFTEKEGIQVFLLGGSLLGAVRHDGFIPWDDDFDIGMLRVDYNRFIQEYHPQNTDFEMLREGDAESWVPYSRLVDKTTQAISKYYRMNHGVFVDIFPIDGICSSKLTTTLYYFSHKFLNMARNISRSTGILPEDAKLKWIKKIGYLFLGNTNPAVWARLEIKLAESFQKRHSGLMQFVVLNGMYGQKELIARMIFGTPTPIEFEKMQFWRFEDDAAYLAQFFGIDWEIPKQIETHAKFYHIERE